MRYILLSSLLFATACSNAQNYNEEIRQHRAGYKQEFLEEENSPLKASDTGYLDFFAPDSNYKVIAQLILTPDSPEFEIPTSSTKTKTYKQYGTLHFTIHDTAVTLNVYQSMKLIKMRKYKDLIFVPFKDLTNYEETYGGGRYIDLSLKDITDEQTIVLDFNKCYNPYCAYPTTGYSCPIPPEENKLPIAIKAGEKSFGKEH